MKRTGLFLSWVLAIGMIAASSVGAASPRARLRAPTCVTALDPPARAISITATMRPLANTNKLQVKFDLTSRAGTSGPFTRVRGGDLSTWVTPKDRTLGQHPGDVWNVIKQVVDLKAPATYRFKVSFRWLGPHGNVLGTAVKTSATCFQPELRPDLQVKTIGVQAVAGHPNVDEYVALIRNNGASHTGAFDVRFTDGAVVKTRSVADLESHASMKEYFVGPSCATGMANITADPGNQVDDLNRANNSLNVVCSGSAKKGSPRRATGS
jgi:hypothetical protein